MRPPEPCEFLAWDTEFFQHRIARVIGTHLRSADVQAILDWCRYNRIQCLYFLATSSDSETVRLAEDHGFRMVDIRVTMQRNLATYEPRYQREALKDMIRVRPWRPSDLPVLELIARSSHVGTRFYADPGFPKEDCQALYETWIRKSCAGDADVVLVSQVDGQPVGYITCHLPHDQMHGQIGLVGVARDARGRGVGQSMVHAAVDWFASNSAHSISIATQGHNVKAQQLYQKCAFLTHSVQIWYHKWMPDLAEGTEL